MRVIGLVGQRLSGKNVFSGYLRRKYGFAELDFTREVLAPILRKEGKLINRENLVKTAMSLREKDGTDVLARLLCRKIENGNYVIPGVRFPAEVKRFRKEFGDRFVLIGIGCGSRIRFSRISRKGRKEDGKMSYRDFLRKERLPTEIVIPKTMRLAEFTVKNERTKEELYMNIDKLMEKII